MPIGNCCGFQIKDRYHFNKLEDLSFDNFPDGKCCQPHFLEAFVESPLRYVHHHSDEQKGHFDVNLMLQMETSDNFFFLLRSTIQL